MRIKFLVYCFVIVLAATAVVSVSAQDAPKTPPADKPAETKPAEQSPLIAEWAVTISAPGQEIAGTLKLEKDGETIKGTLSTMLGDAPVKNVKIEGDAFNGDMTANVQGQTFEGTINGKLKDGKLSGEINLSGLGAIPYEGTKSEKK